MEQLVISLLSFLASASGAPVNEFGFTGPHQTPPWQHPLVLLVFWLILTGILTLAASIAVHQIAKKRCDWLRLCAVGLIPAIVTLLVIALISGQVVSFSPTAFITWFMKVTPTGYVFFAGMIVYGFLLSWWAEKAQSE